MPTWVENLKRMKTRWKKHAKMAVLHEQKQRGEKNMIRE
jgi:hypothetical protein